jgi:hypothetical protein
MPSASCRPHLRQVTDSSPSYLIHVSDNCPWCLRAKALLEHYGASYTTTAEPCDEWSTWPAIYKLTASSKELIGGYDQLCELLLED